jgi:site-specific DNA recombinase
VLVREYQGERHTVTVVPGGFVWREATYASLSNVARAITGTAWNGPRFFGLRGPGNPVGEHGIAPAKPTEAPQKRRAGRSAGGVADRPAGGLPMKLPKLARCAIYTRKSTEHNLDREFNSLDAQREACEAYIKSQAHEGWRLIPDRYDDGGLSGASLDRPALQTLLTDVRAGKITIVVVYKVDRLTRSLADFAKLVELFDQHGVSFVSVTQSFPTTSSMGRLTLNVLLSFAQFEREVIGERVRDKIAASKRKGIWVGGPVPLGYVSVGKKLMVVPEEAETVRAIFARYLELGSMGALIEDLDRRGIRTKARRRTDGRVIGGIRFGVGPLAYLLKNRFYIGEVVYRGEFHRGEHEPILDCTLFEAVQAKLAANAVDRQVRLKGSPAILAGRIFDDRGSRMSPTHSNKLGVRYRYYVSHAVLQKRKADAGSVARLPAPEVETLVLDGLRRHLAATAGAGPSISMADRDLIERHVERIMVKPHAIQVWLVASNNELAQAGGEDAECGDENRSDPGSPTLMLPWAAQSFSAVKGILHAPAPSQTLKPETRDAVLLAIAKARAWIDHLIEHRVASFAEIAAGQGRTPHPPARAARFRLAEDHRGAHRRHRPCRPHRDRSRQDVALLLDQAGTADGTFRS